MSKRIAAAVALFALPAAVVLSFSAFWRPKLTPEPAPDPGILPPDDYQALLEVVGTYFALRNRRAAIQGREVVVDGPEGRARYSLQALADECRGQNRDVWPQVAGRYFASAVPAAGSAPAAPAQPGTAPERPAPPQPLWPDIAARPAAPAAPVTPPPGAPVRPIAPPQRPAQSTVPVEPAMPPQQPPARPAASARDAVLGKPAAPAEPLMRLQPLSATDRPQPAAGRPQPEVRPRPAMPPEQPTPLEWPVPPQQPVLPEPPARPVMSARDAVLARLPDRPRSSEHVLPPRPRPIVPPARPVTPPLPLDSFEPEAPSPAAHAGPAPRPAMPPESAAAGGADDDAASWAAFSAMVQSSFRRHGFDAVVEPDGVIARDGSGQEQQLESPGLERLARQLPREQWPRLIDVVFGEALRSLRAAEVPAARSIEEAPDVPAGRTLEEPLDLPAGWSFVEPPDVPAGRTLEEPPDVPAGWTLEEAPDVPAGRRVEEARDVLSGRSYAEVRDLLAVQLFDQAALSDEEREATIYSDELPGLLSAVVCRLPEGTHRLPPTVVQEWGVGAEEVFMVGLSNLRRLRPRGERVAIAPGMEALCLRSDDEFAAAQALLLGDDPACSGHFGALVAAPRRGLLLVCPLRPMAEPEEAVSTALMSLVESIEQSRREGQTVLTRNLYWYHGGAFTELPYEVQTSDGKPSAELYPPAAFLGALEQLGRGLPAI